jgi:hypothetical protein
LSFGDFLASVALDDDNQNAGNNALRPVQSWDLDIEANRRFGPWGSLKLEYSYRDFEDFIDFFPLDNGGEARGNIGDAQSTRMSVTGTLKLDPIGARGVRFDVNASKAWLSVTDPFTGLDRPFSNNTIDYVEATGPMARDCSATTMRPIRAASRSAAAVKARPSLTCSWRTRTCSA